MRIAIIGRNKTLFATAESLASQGHEIKIIITAKEATEYTKTSQDFEQLAEKWGIPFVYSPRIVEKIEEIKKADVDIGVSINYPGIIPQSVIDLFPLGIINAHGGDLPRYRGNACQAWAIINGERRIGLCVHKMVGGELDSGDIIGREYLQIDCHTKIGDVLHWFDNTIPSLILGAVNELSTNPNFILEQQSKDPKDALRCYPRKPEDGRIDWTKPATDVLRLINASNKPYAGAFCDFEGEKMIIWDAELVADDEVFCAVPGQVTKIADGIIEVACGEGKLRLLLTEIKSAVLSSRDLITSLRQRLS